MTTDNHSIVIVDDKPENIRLLAGILSEKGYRIRPAANGQQALTTIEKEAPDLILLDIMMPGLNGYEVCRILKNSRNAMDIPVIFISALDEIGDKVEAFASGGVDYICKPFQTEEVLARVNTHLKLRKAQKLLQEQNEQLQKALDEIRILRGIIPICTNCKKIRDDEGYWNKMEKYIQEHSQAVFSHSLCPECIKELYPELADKVLQRIDR